MILGGRGAVGIAIITMGINAAVVNQTQYSLVIFSTIFISLLLLLFLRRRSNVTDTNLDTNPCI